MPLTCYEQGAFVVEPPDDDFDETYHAWLRSLDTEKFLEIISEELDGKVSEAEGKTHD